MPRFKKKGKCDEHFRMRNKKNDVRVGVTSIRLPKIGEIPVAQSTRRLRRMLREGSAGAARAKVLFVTVTRVCGVWYARLNVEAALFHPATHSKLEPRTVGIDRGLTTFAVAAIASGEEVWRNDSPKPLQHAMRRLRRHSRALSRKQQGSRGRGQARLKIARLHHRIANIRRAHAHVLTTHIAKTHSHVVLEDLHIAGMLTNHRLARHIADSSWGLFARQLRYKGDWYACRIDEVNRFAPTSKVCCRCDWQATEMPLHLRQFTCGQCGWTADRDTNAAANCARWAETCNKVASKQEETLNACGVGSSGRAWRGETTLVEARRVKAPKKRLRLTSEKDAVNTT